MKKRIVIAMVTGLIIASLAGCGTKTGATDQEVPENSAVESGAETDSATDEITSTEVIGDDTEETNEIVGAEEIIEFFDEKGPQEFTGLSELAYEPYDGAIRTDSYVPVYDGDGYYVGQIQMGATVYVTETSTDMWVRFENPIKGTEYDYLYTPKDFVASDIQVDAVIMAQKIQDYINMYGIQEVEYTFVNEKASDMEVYEFRMDSVYDDELLLEYWIRQNLSVDNTDILYYETLYVECEEDTDGWIICRIYYKDKVEFEY